MYGHLDQKWLIDRAKAMLAHSLTGVVDFDENDILNCLLQETIPTFSIFLPHYTEHTINSKLDRLQDGKYILKTDYQIIRVEKIYTGNGAFGIYPYDPILINNMIDRQHLTDQMSAIEVTVTFRFEPPNIIEIYPKSLPYEQFLIKIATIHPSHLKTIPFGSREVLKNLFLADLATDLLSIRNYFQNINSPFAEINLNIEYLTNIASKRDEIINQLAENQLKSGLVQRLYIA